MSLISLLEKPLNKRKPKPTFAHQLTYNWRVCEGGLGWRVCGEENPLGSGQRKQSKMSDKERGWEEREEERRGIAEREVGRLRDCTDCQVTRSRGEKRRARGGHPISVVPALGYRDPAAADTTCGAELVGRGGLGWNRDQRTLRPGLHRPCCTPGIRDSPSAQSSGPLRPGAWTWREIRTLPGEWVVSRQPPSLGAGSIDVYKAPTVCGAQPLSPPAAGLRNCSLLFSYPLKLGKNPVCIVV